MRPRLAGASLEAHATYHLDIGIFTGEETFEERPCRNTHKRPFKKTIQKLLRKPFRKPFQATWITTCASTGLTQIGKLRSVPKMYLLAIDDGSTLLRCGAISRRRNFTLMKKLSLLWKPNTIQMNPLHFLTDRVVAVGRKFHP